MSFQSLCIPEPFQEGMTDDFPEVEDPKQVRSVTMAFPFVRLTELSGKDEQMAAEQSLKLVEKMDAVKLQSYLDLQFKKYLETCPTDASTSKKERRAHWAQSFYYEHLRNFTARDCLDSRAFIHRFVGATFIPMIPAQSFGDEEKKRDAVDAIALMKPH